VTPAELASLVDHTLLKPDAARRAVSELCAEAVLHSFRNVCVNSSLVAHACSELSGTGVGVCSVAGFPLGATTAKAWEAGRAVFDGASEIDMVIDTGLLKEGMHHAAALDIAGVVSAACGRPVKVILETCLLTDDEKLTACRLAEEAGAAFVKTSTGFGAGGATAEDVALLARAVGGRLGVKASGGISNLDSALSMLRAGATRLGLSRSVQIIVEMEKRAAGGVDQPPAEPPVAMPPPNRS
jgi:deoxyribose-phosphate aldolase